ncbi:MAG TPA: HAD family hydrolase [Bryobacteraceae bacterium]|jgi:HAD superfamily hydrolase (TIGR01509 family)
MLKAVLCDIDGTLVDSNVLHAEAWVRAFAHFGYRFSLDDVLHQIGKGGDQLIPHYVPSDRLADLEEPIKKFRKDLFHEQYFDRIKAFPGSRALIEKMRRAGLRIALASSADKEDLGRLKRIAQIEDLVEEETAGEDADKSKPHPDIFKAALDRLRVDSSEAMALGDTPWDIEAAAKAGLPTVAVTSGGWAEDQLRTAGAIAVYKGVAEIAERFERSEFNAGTSRSS